jgi:hypothetical protein
MKAFKISLDFISNLFMKFRKISRAKLQLLAIMKRNVTFQLLSVFSPKLRNNKVTFLNNLRFVSAGKKEKSKEKR